MVPDEFGFYDSDEVYSITHWWQAMAPYLYDANMLMCPSSERSGTLETEISWFGYNSYHWYAYTWSNLTGMSTQPGSDSNVSDFILNNGNATPAVRLSLDGGATFVNSVTFTPADFAAKTITVVGGNTNWRRLVLPFSG